MNVANKELCQELYSVSGWDDTYWQYGAKGLKPRTVLFGSKPVPAYNADYLLDKLRNYDFTIVNLNHETLSLTSDSLDDPGAALLGKSLAELLCKLAIELFKQDVLTTSPTTHAAQKGNTE